MGTDGVWGRFPVATRGRASRIFLAFVMALVIAPTNAEDDFPVRPVRIVVPYSPGSTGDVRTRQIAQNLSEQFKQPVVVENRPGAGGIVGARIAAHAAPDGYTLLYMSNPRVLVPHLIRSVGMDVTKDLAPIALIAYGAAVLVTNSAIPANSVKELIALAKSKPSLLTYGSSGIGSVQHVPMEIFKRLAGIQVLHVPFKGDSEILNGLLGGQVSMSFATAASVLPFIKTGKLRALAVGGKKRLGVLPDVQTMAEAGFADFEWHNWYGYAAPSATPMAVIRKLNRAMASYLGLPQTIQELRGLGFEVAGGSPEEFGMLIKRDLDRYSELLRSMGIQPE